MFFFNVFNLFAELFWLSGKAEGKDSKTIFISEFYFGVWCQFSLLSKLQRGLKKIYFEKTSVGTYLSVTPNIARIPKNALSIELPWGWHSFFFQKYSLQFCHLGINRKHPICREVIDWTLIDADPCLKIVIVRDLRNVLLKLFQLDIQTHYSPWLWTFFIHQARNQKFKICRGVVN